MKSLAEAVAEPLTFSRYPRSQWNGLHSTNAFERLSLEFRRRVKTQGSLPSAHRVLALLYGLLATGQVCFRTWDGCHGMARALTETASTEEAP